MCSGNRSFRGTISEYGIRAPKHVGMDKIKRTPSHLIINRPESDNGQVVILLLRRQEYVRSALGTEISSERNATGCICVSEAA
jgi:hypothetical protein